MYLNNRYKINWSRRRQHTQKEISRREGMFLWYKVPKDKHSFDEGYGSHGLQDSRPRQSSGEEEEDNAEPGEVVNEQAPEVSNAASPITFMFVYFFQKKIICSQRYDMLYAMYCEHK